MDCAQCGEQLFSRLERERGTCARCYMASWSPQKAEVFEKPAMPDRRRIEARETVIDPRRDGQPKGADDGSS
jgi:hypothetical protein